MFSVFFYFFFNFFFFFRNFIFPRLLTRWSENKSNNINVNPKYQFHSKSRELIVHDKLLGAFVITSYDYT